MKRRRVLVGGLAVAGLAGCLDVVRGETIEVSASPMRVAETARSETAYTRVGQEAMTVERIVEVVGRSQTIRASNHYTEYEREFGIAGIDVAQAAVFSVLSTPSVSILGREFNPVGEMSAAEIAELVQNRYEDIHELEAIDEESVTVGDSETTMTTFEARGSMATEVLQLIIHITEAAPLGDDLVITVAAYPRMADEGDNIRRLVAAIEKDE